MTLASILFLALKKFSSRFGSVLTPPPSVINFYLLEAKKNLSFRFFKNNNKQLIDFFRRIFD